MDEAPGLHLDAFDGLPTRARRHRARALDPQTVFAHCALGLGAEWALTAAGGQRLGPS
ncbi:MAG TPA: hypothetical protein VMA77_12635 [Solirubrobacteraceae bacterium]|nr:hypothetical protein [Solirubrobacteraceae bacterium]